MNAKIINSRLADADHAVTTVQGGKGSYRKEPCADCPWKTASVGIFPAKAFEHSANTAYDMSTHQFGCHESGTERPATCAGFLLRGAMHNLATRLAWSRGSLKDDVSDAGHELFDDYRSMAVANGVDPASPALSRCR
jgi:Family of unknown function (DUF6283)